MQSVVACNSLLETEVGNAMRTHLVKVLQKVDYPTLNLLLVETGGSGVESDTLVGKARGELSRASDSRATDLEGSRGLDGTRGGGPEGADDSGAEHDGSDTKEKRWEERWVVVRERGDRKNWGVVMMMERNGDDERDQISAVWILLRLGGSKILAAGQSGGGRKP